MQYAPILLFSAALAAGIGPRPGLDLLEGKSLAFPVKGYEHALRDNFDEPRGSKPHEALDIMAPRGTPVVAVDDGTVAKLFKSIPGGLTIYLFDANRSLTYYYAHLDHYAPGMREGGAVKRGEVIGYVGSTGNARADAPHLHFAVIVPGPDKKWWQGTAINPYARFDRGRHPDTGR